MEWNAGAANGQAWYLLDANEWRSVVYFPTSSLADETPLRIAAFRAGNSLCTITLAIAAHVLTVRSLERFVTVLYRRDATYARTQGRVPEALSLNQGSVIHCKAILFDLDGV